MIESELVGRLRAGNGQWRLPKPADVSAHGIGKPALLPG
jgi:hypothetical protein